MKKILKIECIGGDGALRETTKALNALSPYMGDLLFGYSDPRYFVAEISGFDKTFFFRREFIKGKKDYSQANSKGTRGVYIYYILEEGRIYDIKQPLSWKKTDRYFCTVVNGEIIKMTYEEVKHCLAKKSLERTYTKPPESE